ncbi:RNA polymerase sigma factor CnrH [Usitatibacter rugosus]|uniref:RNA polymerase sigma factor CnrH n=1 Tax=Usitatibacter rugosus TaxID=2732067 RepID=A0A6M4GUL2_9PROT|nr:sigma-70 family RNA polymerase sigma factor [Usitatibacter rugosus]QJR11010.1 RNA polymerase sigma factor CnrH [Usitatibacter rugosus]
MDPQERFLGELEAHKKILYKVASLYCANAQDRQDLMQETAVQLWRSHGRFDGRSSFATWMYRVALNVAISWVRDDSRRNRHVATDAHVIDTALADEATHDAPPHLRVFLGQLLESLDALDRALVLLYLEGHDQDEIAAILGLTATNVATKINRIKTRLQREHGGSGT